MRSELNILFVEDEPLDAELCEHELRHAGLNFRSRRVCTRDALTAAIQELVPDVVLSDFSMPTDLDGFAALELTRAAAPEVPFIFVSGTIGEERAVAALKAGATDYVLKDRLERLPPVVSRALEEAQARRNAALAQDALRESEARFRSFMEYLPGNASICDAQGRYRYVNEVWERTFGLPAADVLGKRDEDLPARPAADMMDTHQEVLRRNSPVVRMTRAGQEGETKWWLSHHFPIPSRDAGVRMVGTIAVDVTERTLQEEKIARLSRIHAVLSGINSAIVRLREVSELYAEACRIAREEGRFGLAWIGTIDELTSEVMPVAGAGLDPGEDIATSPLLINGRPRPGGVIDQMLNTHQPAICNDITEGVEQQSTRRKEAVRRGYRSMIALPLIVGERIAATFCLYSKETNAFNAEEVRLLMQLGSDVAFALEYIDKERRLIYLASYDPVTGLANRSRLHEQLQYALNAAEPQRAQVAVVAWDINRFRVINNTFGRAAGDELLRMVAAKVVEAWPRVEHMARLSADCFAGFVTKIPHAPVIAQWLERSAGLLAKPVVVNGTELLIGVTAGVAMYPTDGFDAETLLENAEAALKQAKLRSERYVFYEPAMNARVAEKLTLESKLRGALDKDQFVIH
jgi:diguanylate cyclase (GGDEF)-like protein/PAS domain S-box-containing protein